MLFAAGLGTRLKPLTDTMPKAMVPVGNRPLIDIVLHKLIDAGASEIVINVHHFAEQIISYVNSHEWNAKVYISDESKKLLDTGGGIKHAASQFTQDNRPILIHNVDILSNANLTELYNTHANSDCDAMLLISNRKTQRYLLFDDDMYLMGWTNIATGEIKSPYEKLDLDKLHRYAFSGIHSFSPRLFKLMESLPDKFPIMDFYLNACAKCRIKGYMQKDLKMLDVGKLDTLDEANKWVKCNIKE